MSDTVIARVNKLSWNEPNQLIFTNRRGCPIGDIDTIGVDRDTDDSNKNQSAQDPPHKIQATEETEEDTVILDTNIDLDINQETPI